MTRSRRMVTAAVGAALFAGCGGSADDSCARAAAKLAGCLGEQVVASESCTAAGAEEILREDRDCRQLAEAPGKAAGFWATIRGWFSGTGQMAQCTGWADRSHVDRPASCYQSQAGGPAVEQPVAGTRSQPVRATGLPPFADCQPGVDPCQPGLACGCRSPIEFRARCLSTNWPITACEGQPDRAQTVTTGECRYGGPSLRSSHGDQQLAPSAAGRVWRCITDLRSGRPAAQYWQNGQWNTDNLYPRDCAACCGRWTRDYNGQGEWSDACLSSIGYAPTPSNQPVNVAAQCNSSTCSGNAICAADGRCVPFGSLGRGERCETAAGDLQSRMCWAGLCLSTGYCIPQRSVVSGQSCLTADNRAAHEACQSGSCQLNNPGIAMFPDALCR